ncbi:MAG: AzlC family ABC transporter permease [Eubacteriales bacterium]|nr:AzlC family ABC transporter permease [Eubacteriales bacterium]
MESAAQNKKTPKTTPGWFVYGLRNGIPICMGYFAVSFALGIAARNIGMNALQSGIMSAAMVASAGEFAALTLIASNAGVIEMITTALIVNLRYFLMSCSLTQKLKPGSNPLHRMFLAQFVTDEIFGLSVTVEGYLNPFYTYGIGIISVFGWCTGTVLGVLMGNILPGWATDALSVAMYGMFLAIIIPPSKKNHFIGILVAISMAASWIFTEAPVIREISSGFRIIILTVVIAGIAAVIRPIPDENEEADTEQGDA